MRGAPGGGGGVGRGHVDLGTRSAERFYQRRGAGGVACLVSGRDAGRQRRVPPGGSGRESPERSPARLESLDMAASEVQRLRADELQGPEGLALGAAVNTLLGGGHGALQIVPFQRV